MPQPVGPISKMFDFAVTRAGTELDALVVVVDRHGQDALRVVLPDDVVVQELEDLARLRELVEAQLGCLGELLFDDLVAEVDALVTDVDTRTGNELLHLLLRLAAEAALQQLAPIAELRHRVSPVLVSREPRPCPVYLARADRAGVVGHLAC